MSKLIGTNPNQVPSNADLGSAAFMDAKEFLLARGSSLSAIDAIIPKTATDVCVYDTSLDSDGGAWRKRTQHTSWYNERLNTTTRGSRKEFPAVAVIVVTGTQMIIYDADDTNLSMWMVFTRVSGSGNFFDATQPQKVTAKNAILYPAGNGGSILINFISEYNAFRNNTRQYNKGNISERNSGKGWVVISGANDVFLSFVINDVAMTVLPNAPIDSATGLPVPTIAVATDGGVSVIKDDGTVVDITHSSWSKALITFFTKDNLLAYLSTNSPGQQYGYHYVNIPSSDISNGDGRDIGTYDVRFYNSDGRSYTPSLGAQPYAESFIDGAVGYNNAGNISSLALLEKDPVGDYTKSSVAFIKTNFNTGWMPGDIKLATLSDTDAADVTGSNLISGDAASDDTNSTGSWVNSGMATFESSTTQVYSGTYSIHVLANSNGDSVYRNFTVETGKTYTFTAAVYQASASQYRFGVGTGGTSTAYYSSGDVTSHNGSWKIHSVTFTATSGSAGIFFAETTPANSCDLYIDALSVRLAEEDRSVNGNGLQVFGTVTKNPVATGADLVAYSGWSTSNKLIQPHNSYMNFGTGDIAMMGWLYLTTYQYSGIAEYANPGLDANGSVLLFLNNDGQIRLLTRSDGGGWNDFYSGTVFSKNGWNHLCALRRSGGTKEIYFNGNLVATGSDGGVNVTNSINNTEFSLGHRIDGSSSGQPLTGGSISLFRVSATTPSADQIKKMYEDEKVLFQENAKATLYGTSNAVTALAYDDSTNLLHVGTSAGRSVFQGLRRVDNTTDAVGTAISAVNGMVVEE
jgi:hypothetical protein